MGLPGKEANIRGFSASIFSIIDEAARVPDELYKTLRPMLTVANGDLWLLSTPWGKQGFFMRTGSTAAMRGLGFGCRRRSVRGLRRSGWRWSGGRWAMRGSGRNILCEFVADELGCSMGIW